MRSITSARPWQSDLICQRPGELSGPMDSCSGRPDQGAMCPRVHFNPPPRTIVRLKPRCAFRREATSMPGPDPRHTGTCKDRKP